MVETHCQQMDLAAEFEIEAVHELQPGSSGAKLKS
jgi:ATP-dependent 26S proteasome regulatory subunit